MDCETLREDLLAVLYGEADAATQARVEKHRAECAACRDALASLRELRRTLASWKVPEQAAPGTIRLIRTTSSSAPGSTT